MAQDWKQIVDGAQAEIESLEIQREEIDRRIAHLKRTIVAAKPLSEAIMPGLIVPGIIEIESEGITDACRNVLRSSQKWMSPLSVRAALEANGLDLSKQRNAMASVHAVLKRLKAKHEAKTAVASDGGTVYKWRPSLFSHPKRPDPVPPPPDFDIVK
jgi:hypothetical protein